MENILNLQKLSYSDDDSGAELQWASLLSIVCSDSGKLKPSP